MALEITGLQRTFLFKSERTDNEQGLPDPGTAMSPAQVKEFYCAQYPELLNSTIGGPEIKNGKARYTFNQKTGTHG